MDRETFEKQFNAQREQVINVAAWCTWFITGAIMILGYVAGNKASWWLGGPILFLSLATFSRLRNLAEIRIGEWVCTGLVPFFSPIAYRRAFEHVYDGPFYTLEDQEKAHLQASLAIASALLGVKGYPLLPWQERLVKRYQEETNALT